MSELTKEQLKNELAKASLEACLSGIDMFLEDIANGKIKSRAENGGLIISMAMYMKRMAKKEFNQLT